MSLSQSLLPEFDQEMANTRKTLERVPDEKFSWKPHEKSGSMGWLAGHLANLVGWAVETITKDGFDMIPGAKDFSRRLCPNHARSCWSCLIRTSLQRARLWRRPVMLSWENRGRF